MLALAAGLATSGATLIARGALLVRRQRALLAAERAARHELARLNAQLAEDSRRDTLTGLRNRRALEEDIHAVEAQALRRGGSFAVALIDVDRFKPYNDRLGHLAGDDALRALAGAIRGELRAGDVAYRYGGEELIVVLADASAGDAVSAGERIRAAIGRLALPHPQGGEVTVSIGVAAGERDVPALLARADAALYAAKRNGRDRVVAASADAPLVPAERRHRVRAARGPPAAQRHRGVPRRLRARRPAAGAGDAGADDPLGAALLDGRREPGRRGLHGARGRDRARRRGGARDAARQPHAVGVVGVDARPAVRALRRVLAARRLARLGRRAAVLGARRPPHGQRRLGPGGRADAAAARGQRRSCSASSRSTTR